MFASHWVVFIFKKNVDPLSVILDAIFGIKNARTSASRHLMNKYTNKNQYAIKLWLNSSMTLFYPFFYGVLLKAKIVEER